MKGFGSLLIEPYKSVGPLILNENRKITREKINEPYDSKTNEFNGIQDNFDYYPESIFIVHYSKYDKVVAFEFFEEFENSLLFNGVDILRVPYMKLIEMFSALDDNLFKDESSFISKKLGISAYCSYNEDELALPETIAIFGLGYYGNIILV